MRSQHGLPVAVVLTLALSCVPSAVAQTTTTTPPGGPSLSPAPPVTLGTPHKAKKKKTVRPPSHTSTTHHSRSSHTRAQLPNTGYDAGGVALLGAGLLLAGVGLRLRTRDVRWP